MITIEHVVEWIRNNPIPTVLSFLATLLSLLKPTRKYIFGMGKLIWFLSVGHFWTTYKTAQEVKGLIPSRKSDEHLVLRNGVYWNEEPGSDEGPYCQRCWDRDNMKIPIGYTTISSTKGLYHCSTCGVDFPLDQYRYAIDEQKCKNNKARC